MKKYKNFLIRVIILSSTFLSTYVCLAEIQDEDLQLAQSGYDKVYPLEVSPTPDIIEDREWLKQQREGTKVKEEPEEKGKPTPSATLVGRKPSQIFYKISINDKLYISVWRVPDLSLEVIVGPDGKISFPLLGDIDAVDKTLAELDSEITEKLKEYVENPQVSVMVREFAGNKVVVLGEIPGPGIYKFVGRTSIIQIIAQAGGFTSRAKSAQIVIIREPEDPVKEKSLIVADIKGILKGNLKKNIEVMPDDIIYVSRTAVANFKELYDNWIVPFVGTATSIESWRSIKQSRQKAADDL